MRVFLTICLLTISTSLLSAQEDQQLPTEQDYYPLAPFTLPEGEVLEIGAIQPIPDGRLAVGTRRGEIWMVENAWADDVSQAKLTRFAHGFHEILGLAWKDGWLYVTHRPDVSRIRDTNDDGVADEFEVINDGWGISGDYHEYAFGSKFDNEGNIWVTLCLTGSFSSKVPYRGWCVRVTPDGKMIPTCSGIRSPGGMGFNHKRDVFYTDNQGPWNGTCSLKWLRPGSFQGHPGGFEWFKLTDAIGDKPQEPESGSRIMVEAKKIPEYEPPVILFPYKKMGQSASGIACDTTDGNFGPFKNQMFVGDQTFSTIMRCYLEEIQGHYQGACFPFREGIGSGSLAVEMTDSGALFVGGTNRGWGSRGNKPFSLDRITWNGKTPFEILEMKARPDGFELVFTQEVDPATVGNIASYKLQTYTYIFQSSYGSPEVDHTFPEITSAEVGADGKSVVLKIDGLQEGHVHELIAEGVRNKDGLPLLHQEAYYTLNYIPQ
ncbi:MAG: hypothetical protein HUJ26_22100 [Planctomycetaceae bacterium]|nr:hypothetical protein [Planctomycetaceae bacterium]